MTDARIDQEDHVNTEYDSVACPLPGCGSPLHLQRTTDRAVLSGDFADAQVLDHDDAHTSTWQVLCEDGHVVLLPGPTGCPHGCDDNGEPCPHEATFDGSDDYRTFQPHDLGRLANLLKWAAR